MRLGDLDALKKNMEFICMGIMAGTEPYNAPLTEIDNAPTVPNEYMRGYEAAEREYKRPQGECKTCKYYHPYFKQFSNEPRGDGYCVIARMTPEGMTTINCNDEFGCSDYQKGGADMRGGEP